MKKILIPALPVLTALMLALKPIDNPLPIGAPIPNPELKMKNIDGSDISFKEAMNKNGLLVMFSCNTCPVVKGYQPRCNEICKYAISNQIGVILLNSNEAYRKNGDSFDDMKAYGHNNNYTWSYVVDKNSEMANVFGATRTPECFLFNKDGKLVYHGAIDNNSNSEEQVTRKHLAIAIDEMIAGKEILVTETRSVGCSIKRNF
ncbi:MAG: thioredoxin family protein [Bacteroidetes bacterium]|nr:thioredoxin family protein [Bacteroidota bacterium]MBS1931922.1 thioredoxin family protein [Bacteroidota bacterium]